MAKRAKSQSEQAVPVTTLENKVAMLYDGSNEDGRFLAVSLASRGADIALVYRKGHLEHARETKRLVEAEGRRCLIVPLHEGKVLSRDLIQQTTSTLGRLDIFIDSSSPPIEASGLAEAE
jgi:NAD(P)-dependent dehydrogenase (short-subunit alcohol dehydrogenase family)